MFYEHAFFGRGAFLQALTPQGPLLQRMVHHCYMQWYIPTCIGKFFLLSEALQVYNTTIYKMWTRNSTICNGGKQ